MPIRNPFARRTHDDSSRPAGDRAVSPGFERVDTIGSLPSSALSTLSTRSRSRDTSQEAGEFKMSVVNDSGVYLPPSPTEKKGNWPGNFFSRSSSDTKTSSVGEIEPFYISRESFDSYRRSFDISAKSPITSHSLPARQSLDSARSFSRSRRVPLGGDGSCTPEEDEHDAPTGPDEAEFEDVGLDDAWTRPMPLPLPRRKGFFAKLAENTTATTPSGDSGKETSVVAGSGLSGVGMVERFFIPSRRRGQSQSSKEFGSELGNIIRKPEAGDMMEVH